MKLLSAALLLLALAACGGNNGAPPSSSSCNEVPVTAVTYSASGVAIPPAPGQHSGIFVCSSVP